MKMEFSFSQLLLIIAYFKLVKLVPDEYCLPPLNKSDCGTPLTPVFSYYKYGSRCEIEFWRGCPTKNKFENEYHCSHYCIGKLRYYGRARGSWKGRGNSIDDMSLSDLEDLNRILHKINDSVTDKSELQKLERLINMSPIPRPKVSGETTTVHDENEESYEHEDLDDADYITVKPINGTQMPMIGVPSSGSEIEILNGATVGGTGGDTGGS